MKSRQPSFVDIHSEQRRLLEAAAKRAGLPLVDWLDRVIMQAAQESESAPNGTGRRPQVDVREFKHLDQRLANIEVALANLTQMLHVIPAVAEHKKNERRQFLPRVLS